MSNKEAGAQAKAGETIESQLARVVVVLKDTTHPGNIGAAARAIKTMGLSRLVLVAPKANPASEQARANAANAADVLAAARVYDTLPQALAGCARAIAFSARRRGISPPRVSPKAAAEGAWAVAAGGGVCALVFGGERSGLANEDIFCCQQVAEIPTSPSAASLNLAQATQVAAYEARLAALASRAAAPAPADEMPSQQEVENMLAHGARALAAVGLPKPGNRPLLPRLRLLLARAAPLKSEVRMLRGVFRAIIYKQVMHRGANCQAPNAQPPAQKQEK